MRTNEVRVRVEEELTWRQNELRSVRNKLMNDKPTGSAFDQSARTLVVLQYAHLEGFVKQSLSIYAEAINAERLVLTSADHRLVASGLAKELAALRAGTPDAAGSGALVRTDRAVRETEFVTKLLGLAHSEIRLDIDKVVSMEMNLSSDVLRRTLYRLGIDDEGLSARQYSSLEFVRKMRNEVAHGKKTASIHPSGFRSHVENTNMLMGDLVRLIGRSCRFGAFRNQSV